jgi:hypothetical protein
MGETSTVRRCDCGLASKTGVTIGQSNHATHVVDAGDAVEGGSFANPNEPHCLISELRRVHAPQRTTFPSSSLRRLRQTAATTHAGSTSGTLR